MPCFENAGNGRCIPYPKPLLPMEQGMFETGKVSALDSRPRCESHSVYLLLASRDDETLYDSAKLC